MNRTFATIDGKSIKALPVKVLGARNTTIPTFKSGQVLSETDYLGIINKDAILKNYTDFETYEKKTDIILNENIEDIKTNTDTVASLATFTIPELREDITTNTTNIGNNASGIGTNLASIKAIQVANPFKFSGVWSATETYNQGYYVFYDKPGGKVKWEIYVSIVDGNIGNTPQQDANWALFGTVNTIFVSLEDFSAYVEATQLLLDAKVSLEASSQTIGGQLIIGGSLKVSAISAKTTSGTIIVNDILDLGRHELKSLGTARANTSAVPLLQMTNAIKLAIDSKQTLIVDSTTFDTGKRLNGKIIYGYYLPNTTIPAGTNYTIPGITNAGSIFFSALERDQTSEVWISNSASNINIGIRLFPASWANNSIVLNNNSTPTGFLNDFRGYFEYVAI